MKTSKRIFKVGNPVPLVWLHMEFDWNDTMAYRYGKLIPTQEEADRLEIKYAS